MILKFKRRSFLAGAGKAAVAIPALPSLDAKASTCDTSKPERKFISFRSWYGFARDNWYKGLDDQSLLTSTGVDGVFGAKISDLPGPINPVIANHFSGLESKMAMILGLDVINSEGHGPSGLTASKLIEIEKNVKVPIFPYSLDNLLEISPNFYSSPAVLPALRLSPGRHSNSKAWSHSWTWNGERPVQLPYQNNVQAIIDTYFVCSSSGGGLQKFQKSGMAVDLVVDSAKRLRNNPRLSREDKQRLENYLDLLRDVEARMRTTGQSANCCPAPAQIAATNMDEIYSNNIDVAVAALACGMTRIVNIECRHFQSGLDYQGSAFHAGTHVENADQTAKNLTENSWIVQRVAELSHKLDSVQEANCSSLLDNSILLWHNELGARQHWHRQENMPALILSGLSSLRQGHIFDYRQRPFVYYADRRDFPEMGQPWQRLLISIMRSLGLNESDWEKLGAGTGFGNYSTHKYSRGRHDRFLVERNANLDHYYIP